MGGSAKPPGNFFPSKNMENYHFGKSLHTPPPHKKLSYTALFSHTMTLNYTGSLYIASYLSPDQKSQLEKQVKI